ncbi:MAG TPA: YncE family protein [Gemmatimonadaceae bacterium]|nr:YncE family protein [Gemmatimonadaceae bacterium]
MIQPGMLRAASFVGRSIAAAVALAPATLSAQTLTGTIVSANMTANTASVVDVATGQLRATYPTGDGPHEVAMSNDGRWAVVSIYGNRASVGHSLLVLDLTGGAAPRTIEMGQYLRPHGMRFTPDDKRLIVTSEATQRVVIVNFTRGAIDTTIFTGQPATHMVVLGPGAKRAFTTNISAKNISVLDLERDTIVRTIDAGARIEGIAVNPSATEVWVGANDDKVVLVFNPATGEKVAQIDGFGMPYRMSITPDGATAVISDPGNERVVIADAKTHRVRSTLDMTKAASSAGDNADHPSPQGVTLSRDGRLAFVTLKALGKVAVIDIAAGTIMKTLNVGGGSDGVGYSPVSATQRSSP